MPTLEVPRVEPGYERRPSGLVAPSRSLPGRPTRLPWPTRYPGIETIARPRNAIAFIADNATPTYATRTNTTITRPTGSDGTSLKIAMVSTDDQAVTTNANWTQFVGSPLTVTGTIRAYFYWTFHDAASWTFNHNSDGSNGYCIAYSGVDTGTPIDVNPTTNTGSSSPVTWTGLTASVAGVMLVALYIDNTSGITVATPSGMTSREATSADAKGCFEQLLVGSGATGNKTGTYTGSTSWGGILIALRPPTVASTGNRGLINGGDINRGRLNAGLVM